MIIRKLTLCFILSIICFTTSQAQKLNYPLCRDFLEAKELYILDNDLVDQTLVTSDGKRFNFEQLVKENWPDKKIIRINAEKYDKLPKVGRKFHIYLAHFSSYTTGGVYAARSKEYDGILVQKGKVGKMQKSKYLYFLSVNINEILEGVLTERLIYAVENLRDIFQNYNQGNFRNSFMYKVYDYEKYLETHTLYFRKSELYADRLNTREVISKQYPYKFKIVTDEEWLEAIKTKKENIAYLEHLGNGSSMEVDVRTTQGKLLVTSFGWFRPIKLSRRNFRLLFRKD